MRIPILFTFTVALLVLVAVVLMGQMLIQPDLPLITAAAFAPDRISPNADNNTDVTVFSYSLSRGALVSLVFEGEDGSTYVFRENQSRPADDYRVEFSGVVDGFKLPDEEFAGEVLRRLMPDGTYIWRLMAVGTQRDETDERTGTLIIENGDSPLPDITVFEVSPKVFTPNQDGIRDRLGINVYLTKEATLTVYLVGEDGQRIYIPERKEDEKIGEDGRHYFDYDGGVDLNLDPPPDGTYMVVAQTRDSVGQEVQRTAELTIEQGGKPLAEIVPQTIGVDAVFEAMAYDERYFATEEKLGDLIPRPQDPQAFANQSITLAVGDMLVFMVTVENYSKVPIRTSGPPPGTVYQQDQRDAALGWFEEAGAWRVGIDCTTAASDFPWRWAIGTDDDLVTIVDPDTGKAQKYLPPSESAVVWGAIRMTEIEVRNPQDCWVGLIHEQVEVSLRNNNVGRREVELVDPEAGTGSN
jgi:hypothetical protein